MLLLLKLELGSDRLIHHAVLLVELVCFCLLVKIFHLLLLLDGEGHRRLLLLELDRSKGRRQLLRGRRVEPVALDALDGEDDVLVDFLVHRQFTSLAEGPVAPLMVALERFLLRVDVHVLLQVLSQGKGLEAQDADVLLDRGVGCDVSPEGEACCVGLIAARHFAFIRSFHFYAFSISDSQLIILLKSMLSWPLNKD